MLAKEEIRKIYPRKNVENKNDFPNIDIISQMILLKIIK